MQINLELLKKYDVPVPRYTSYPTVPHWTEGVDKTRWLNLFEEQFHHHNSKEGLSLYIHLPFCESLCTYCGCNKKITTNHAVEGRYLSAIKKEWELYLSLMAEAPVIREIHLGGGTPTFFSAGNLAYLINTLLKNARLHPRHEFSIEGHPGNTTEEHLKTLYDLGFRKISYGVQDHDPVVQKVINRIQPFEQVRRATENARAAGFQSVNFDLIYGLPLQTKTSIEKTVTQSIQLQPDRVAFYSYAHVPWTSRGQRLFDESDLPSPEKKNELYQTGKKLFKAAGYRDIGMDHFCLPADGLYRASVTGQLHRNFMGYTTRQTAMLIGLGVSSISDIGKGYGQNSKTLHDYYRSIDHGVLPVVKGYFLQEEDLKFRQYILDIACRGKTSFKREDLPVLGRHSFPVLEELSTDGLIAWDEHGLSVTELGSNFLRNICSAFDLHLLRGAVVNNMRYSKGI